LIGSGYEFSTRDEQKVEVRYQIFLVKPFSFESGFTFEVRSVNNVVSTKVTGEGVIGYWVVFGLLVFLFVDVVRNYAGKPPRRLK
jgi:hypothetical protein